MLTFVPPAIEKFPLFTLDSSPLLKSGRHFPGNMKFVLVGADLCTCEPVVDSNILNPGLKLLLTGLLSMSGAACSQLGLMQELDIEDSLRFIILSIP